MPFGLNFFLVHMNSHYTRTQITSCHWVVWEDALGKWYWLHWKCDDSLKKTETWVYFKRLIQTIYLSIAFGKQCYGWNTTHLRIINPGFWCASHHWILPPTFKSHSSFLSLVSYSIQSELTALRIFQFRVSQKFYFPCDFEFPFKSWSIKNNIIY